MRPKPDASPFLAYAALAAVRDPRQPAKPRPAKPSPIMTHVDGSGTPFSTPVVPAHGRANLATSAGAQAHEVEGKIVAAKRGVGVDERHICGRVRAGEPGPEERNPRSHSRAGRERACLSLAVDAKVHRRGGCCE